MNNPMENIMKKLLSMGLFGLLALSANQTILTESTIYSTADTELAFDLDDVVMKRNWSDIKTAMWQYKADFLKNAFNTKLLKMVYQYKKEKRVGSDYINLFRQYAPRIAEFVLRVMHAKQPITGTANIINDLSKSGYELHVASNMSKADFTHFQGAFPQVFSNFAPNGQKVLDFSNGQRPPRKPKHAYFEDYFDNYRTKKKVIFIDDKAKNVKAFDEVCKARGIEGVGIHFTSPKQLAEDLQQLGINVATPVAAQ